ncbi:MAG: hypothetical protein OXC19_16950 [Bryobacterales bacterium]|nr:hypothetical protein [Bryobacterales bacterium]
MKTNNTIIAITVTIGLLVIPAAATAASRTVSEAHPGTTVEARINLNAIQMLRARSADSPRGSDSILSGTERYDLEYFRGISRERYPMTWAVSAQEALDWIDFIAGENLPGFGMSSQVMNAMIGEAVLAMNWADATILGLSDEAATYDEEIAKLQVAIEERDLTFSALLGEDIFNAGFFGKQGVANAEAVSARVWASRVSGRASALTDLVDPEGYIRQRLTRAERELLSFADLISQLGH